MATALAHLERRNRGLSVTDGAFDAVLEHTEWAALPEQLHAVSERAGWEEGGKLIPEKLVQALSIACTPDEAPDRLTRLRASLESSGVDEIALQPSRGTGTNPELLEDIARCVAAAPVQSPTELTGWSYRVAAAKV